MTREEVFKLIQELNDKQSETISIEAKTAYQGKPEKYYDTISSFANTIGGVILFGVKEIKRKNKNKGVKSYIESGLYTFCTYAFFFFFSLASSMSLRMV